MNSTRGELTPHDSAPGMPAARTPRVRPSGRRAGVSDFHGSKQQLFVRVVELPFRPADVCSRRGWMNTDWRRSLGTVWRR